MAAPIGGWAATFAAEAGLKRVVVLERASSAGAPAVAPPGIVRAQGGTPATVALGRWTIDFYRGQQARYGTDSGFRELGYLILAVPPGTSVKGGPGSRCSARAGLDVTWLSADEARAVNPTLAEPAIAAGATPRRDGAIDPPRNVLAYSLAMQQAGVDLRERTAFEGLQLQARPGRRRRYLGAGRSHRARALDGRPDPAQRRQAGRRCASRPAAPATRSP